MMSSPLLKRLPTKIGHRGQFPISINERVMLVAAGAVAATSR